MDVKKLFASASLWDRALALGLTLGHGWAMAAKHTAGCKVDEPLTVLGGIKFFEEVWNAENTIPAGASHGFFILEDGDLAYESSGGRIAANLSHRRVIVRSSRGDLIATDGEWPFESTNKTGYGYRFGPEGFDDPWIAERVLAIEGLLPGWIAERCRRTLEKRAEELNAK